MKARTAASASAGCSSGTPRARWWLTRWKKPQLRAASAAARGAGRERSTTGMETPGRGGVGVRPRRRGGYGAGGGRNAAGGEKKNLGLGLGMALAILGHNGPSAPQLEYIKVECMLDEDAT